MIKFSFSYWNLRFFPITYLRNRYIDHTKELFKFNQIQTIVRSKTSPDLRVVKIAYVGTFVRSEQKFVRSKIYICHKNLLIFFSFYRVVLNARCPLMGSFRFGNIDFRSGTSAWVTPHRFSAIFLDVCYITKQEFIKNIGGGGVKLSWNRPPKHSVFLKRKYRCFRQYSNLPKALTMQTKFVVMQLISHQNFCSFSRNIIELNLVNAVTFDNWNPSGRTLRSTVSTLW